MKIPSSAVPFPSLWPENKAGVMAVANAWYDPGRVAVDEQAIASLALPPIKVGAEPSMAAGKLGMEWQNNVALSLALNSINYQFWDLDTEGKFVRYRFEGIEGAMGMRTAFERAWADPDSPLSAARNGTPLTLEGVRQVFGDIPAAESRVAILNEILMPPQLEQISAEIVQALDVDGIVNTELAKRVADTFPLSYGDPVLKKAQLAVSEVWVKAEAAGQPLQCDLTAFADYQIPNILRAMGVLTYAPDLAQAIDSYQPLDFDSRDERAIRAASLLAVEKIAEQAGVPVAAVDHYLWMRRKEAATPFHLTFTTAY